ncbi:MAG: 50S ribosomal protein L17 [Proteobacteria bacterium]|nr:50S ribosomal protein L17 [Pseudomonadota bacterium]
MKHAIKGRKLNRTSSHRKALFKNLSSSLLKHERIKTTLPKAKDLRSFVERIINLGKEDSLSRRRKVLSVLGDADLVNKLFTDIGSRVKNRNGGYTRIMRSGFRTGDKAPMAIIELVDRKVTETKGGNSSKKQSNKSSDVVSTENKAASK